MMSGKAICSICYEDLKPIVEDLQGISICGHVFHELCIQEMFEYSSKGKKKCPICKQTCSASDVSRLYFQSVGDSNDSQTLQTHKEDPKELKLEVRRLEGKINELSLALECRENDLKNINNALCAYKEQTQTINSLLNLKTQELNKSELERTKLQETNIALAKELAALRLVSNFDLKEKEIVKLASLDEPHSKHSVDILKKTKRLRVCEDINESSNKDGVASCILIDDDDDAPKVSVSPNSSSNDSSNNKDADFCFSAGLVGPGGTQRHLGKWCKKSQSKGFNASFMPTQTSDDLISVGPDGRGGSMKILKSQNLFSPDSKGSLFSAKSDKNGAIASISQSQGSSQIKHFFSKAGHCD